jgi:hypothetical protein
MLGAQAAADELTIYICRLSRILGAFGTLVVGPGLQLWTFTFFLPSYISRS